MFLIKDIRFILVKTVIILLITFLSQANAFELFGPKNFQDCLLQNLKGVNNSEAVNAITAACSMKFNQDESNKSTTNGIRKCYVYWDGMKFASGKNLKQYTKFSISYESVPVLEISFPYVMVNSWTTNHEDKAKEFFDQYYRQIKSICEW
jgi:hypothetical protein